MAHLAASTETATFATANYLETERHRHRRRVAAAVMVVGTKGVGGTTATTGATSLVASRLKVKEAVAEEAGGEEEEAEEAGEKEKAGAVSGNRLLLGFSVATQSTEVAFAEWRGVSGLGYCHLRLVRWARVPSVA
jgi:hypothetical protein